MKYRALFAVALALLVAAFIFVHSHNPLLVFLAASAVAVVYSPFAQRRVLCILNERDMIDKNLLVTKPFPAAGASASTNAIDTATKTAGRVPRVELQLSAPATPSLVDAKTIIYTIEDSDDNVTFAAVADLPTVTSTGAGGAGAAAVSRNFKLPIGMRRFVRATAAVLAAGGDNTALSFQLALVF
jgi:hypothetical protein